MDPKAYANPERGRDFPKMIYGKAGETRVIHKETERPAGWVDHPSELKEPATETEKLDAGKPGKGTGTTAQTGAGGNGTGIAPGTLTELDAHGWPWDEKLHAASKTKTTAGLWRMKVGAARPAPKKGYPKSDKTEPVREQNAKSKAATGEKKFDL